MYSEYYLMRVDKRAKKKSFQMVTLSIRVV